MYIILIESEKKYYILVNNEDYSVLGFNTEKEGIEYFEKAYKSCHSCSYEGSMSACLNFLTFRPSIIKIKDVEDIRDNIAVEKPRKVTLSHVSGSMDVITTREKAKELWESGKKPRLI